MDMARVWPIVVEFGVGAVLFAIGIYWGLKGNYLDLSIPENKRMLRVLIAGYFLLLAVMAMFTFWLPFVPKGGVQ